MRTVTLPSGVPVPVLGQGTWGMGETPERRQEEIAALRFGLDLGLTLIDTAEMYGEGGAEEVVGEAIEGRRDEVYLVSKVYPFNASRRGTVAACERSLKRLKTDRLDLYLLHWRGDYPLSETVEAFEALKEAGAIRDWGVSNFDLPDMKELVTVPNGEQVATDQVLYNLYHREVETALLPWCLKRHIPIMAYSPIEQGRMLDDPLLKEIASRHGITPAQAALAWLLQKQEVIVIAKASKIEHVRQNREALDVHLTIRDLEALDQAYPPPRKPTPLKVH
ncbi:aldo/keto reductase [Candidatus Manganitrophus noduliformans]|uniref:Aldo/keto reductase n=1 Tax=Candidatus Manganitrophus noduliformans TaxID=2606439 RepID=A0A7X6DS01_9BACT|nr:aldo/keto reductase [Candidatus Manganitrophus noduliformans]NKE72269.1 aldo/keto reductase [Candidatus Manganitrophus noduliformans]